MHRLSAVLVLLAGCPAATVDVQIPVDVLYADAPVRCGEALALPGGATGELADARIFLSNVEMQEADGHWTAVDLTPSAWQSEGVVLLDFEDGAAGCSDSGTPEMNGSITGSLPVGSYAGLRFDVGVPFALNHANNATAPAPLNTPGTFWTWQGGYKFVRVDFLVDGDPGSRWNVHLGSTGCVSDAPVNAPSEACGNPNRATLQLAGHTPTQGLSLDLQALVAGADVTDNTPETPPGCMSSPLEPADCSPVFDSLGMDFTTGTCAADCAGQAFAKSTP